MAYEQGGKLLVAYEDGTSELLTKSAVRRVLVAATVTNDDETEATAAAASGGSAAAASAPEPDQAVVEIDKVCSICIDTMASLDASTEVVVFRCGHVFCELHVPLANNLYRLFSCLRHALSIT
jgi:hypothetical protein